MSNKPNTRTQTNNTQRGQQIQLNTDDCIQYVCCECGCEDFVPKSQMFEIPELMRYAFNNQDMVKLEFLDCAKCGTRQIFKAVEGQDVKVMTKRAPKNKACKPAIELVK